MNDVKKDWLYGDSKKDRQGRLIYFIGYSEDTNSKGCLLYTSPSPRDLRKSRMPSSA